MKNGFLTFLLLPSLMLSGCASYGVIENNVQTGKSLLQSYSISGHSKATIEDENNVSLILAFSGGGTRAAALSYGVLEALGQVEITRNGKPAKLLDEVDMISSVSGGSFTAAYYGLFGDRIFSDYKDKFLYQNVQKHIIRGLYNPFMWFGRNGRVELAIKHYDEILFEGATFSDMKKAGGPILLINTSDLATGLRVSFTQEFFNLFCSDIDSYPVARAVAASGAVPVVFNPVVLKNHKGCVESKPEWLSAAQKRLSSNAELSLVTHGMETYYDKDKRPYIHLVDGGITDNLGLRAIYEMVELHGGAKQFQKKLGRKPAEHLVVISVDASIDTEPLMNQSPREPGIEETVIAMSDAQLHRYNAATLELMEHTLETWSQEVSNNGDTVIPHFIRIRFRDIKTASKRSFFNRIPTSLALEEEQVDELINAAHELLHTNPEFQQLLTHLRAN